ITSQVTKRQWHDTFKFITSGRGVQTSSGSLLHTLVVPGEGAYIFGSDDHGGSWYLVETPVRPADESKIVQLANGKWMVNSRVNGSGVRYIHVSDDKGKSWKSWPDSILSDPGCNASLIRYSLKDNGTDKELLIFSNANTSDRRENMCIRVSEDDGMSWTEGKTIYPGSSAYSSVDILSNGNIGVLFEKDDYSEIVFASLPVEWILKK
ncbi:MAG TPA: sialidase family protein, partial [Bacteroidales bacterium]|nr:sialidase family protein [Bacteroidales bacterium]